MKLAEYLSEFGISQADFAAMIGLSAPSVSRLVKGTQRPNLDTILSIERATGKKVTASDFADLANSVSEERAAS